MNINTIRMALSHHSPAIMTGIGVAGVLVTAYSASVATLRAKKKIDEHVEIAAETKYMLTKTDKFNYEFNFLPQELPGVKITSKE